MRTVRTPNYNYNFNPDTGAFIRWGKTIKDDPSMSPLGPELVDIEISTICHGVGGRPCNYCYKSNTHGGYNMTLDIFKKIFHNLPNNVMQIAFGIGDVDSNPDMLKIFKYSRDHGVIPNVTINGDRLTPEILEGLVTLCGAVAVSNHNKEICYDAVKRLTESGILKQVNIHQVLAKETMDTCYELMHDIQTDERLSDLNAVVFLSLKKVGRGTSMTPISNLEFKAIVTTAMTKKIPFGFDSCSCNKFLDVIRDTPYYEKMHMYAEPCESTLFSIYINVFGMVYPCSFCESKQFYIGDATSESVLSLWHSSRTNGFRHLLEASCRSCPVHKV